MHLIEFGPDKMVASILRISFAMEVRQRADILDIDLLFVGLLYSNFHVLSTVDSKYYIVVFACYLQ